MTETKTDGAYIDVISKGENTLIQQMEIKPFEIAVMV